MPYVVKDRGSVEAVAGTVTLVAGVALAGTGTMIGTRGQRDLLEDRCRPGHRGGHRSRGVRRGAGRRGTTDVRPEIGATPASKGLIYEGLTVTTDDGVRLAGWYVASTNRAAVVLLHGAGSTRSDVLDEAAVLAGDEFGVLMIDARGHGDSGGQAMDFGWYGDAGIAAATRFLADRRRSTGNASASSACRWAARRALGAERDERADPGGGGRARPPAAPPMRRGCPTSSVSGADAGAARRVQDWVTDALTSVGSHVGPGRG